MRTEAEIKARLATIEADTRYQSGLRNPATIDINAPLAMLQLSLEIEHKTLAWVLATRQKA
jgi:hypothetical protein